MSKITPRFFMLAFAILLVTCGSKAFRVREVQYYVDNVTYPFAVQTARQKVLPHLHYAVDMRHIDRKRGTIELSFYFIKEQGDSLLWVECVEKIPVSLVDTARCRRWYHSDYIR